jgi:argininosuccinate synthase
MKLVLGYSGSVESSAAIPWLKDRFNAELVAVTLDLGQRRELVEVRERALALGALRCHVIDVREELARQHILPALQAGVLFGECRQMSTALEQPLIVKKLLEVARMERAGGIAHAHSPGTIDHARFERAARALDPSITVIGALDDAGLSPGGLLEYARTHDIPSPSDDDRGAHANLWGRSIAWHPSDDPADVPVESRYTLTRSAAGCPTQPAFIAIEFEAGVPVKANGIEMPLVEMIESLETIAGAHGVGRLDIAVGAAAGSTSRELSEAPAAAILHAAHRELQSLVMARELEPIAQTVTRTYAGLIGDGHWFTPAREALDAFVGAIQRHVTGSIRLELFKGDCRAVERESAPAQTTASGADATADRFDPAAEQLGTVEGR